MHMRAMRLQGQDRLQCDRAGVGATPGGRHFLADLIGLDARDADTGEPCWVRWPTS